MVLIDIASGEQFGRIVSTARNRLICIFFSAVWAVSCDAIFPTVDVFTVLFPDVVFLRITTHFTPFLVPYDVRRVPTFHFVYNRVKVAEFEGNSPRKLVDHLYQLSRDPYSPVITTDEAYNSTMSAIREANSKRAYNAIRRYSTKRKNSTNITNSAKRTKSTTCTESMPGTSQTICTNNDPCTSGTSCTLSTPSTSGTSQTHSTSNNPGTSGTNKREQEKRRQEDTRK